MIPADDSKQDEVAVEDDHGYRSSFTVDRNLHKVRMQIAVNISSMARKIWCEIKRQTFLPSEVSEQLIRVRDENPDVFDKSLSMIVTVMIKVGTKSYAKKLTAPSLDMLKEAINALNDMTEDFEFTLDDVSRAPPHIITVPRLCACFPESTLLTQYRLGSFGPAGKSLVESPNATVFVGKKEAREHVIAMMHFQKVVTKPGDKTKPLNLPVMKLLLTTEMVSEANRVRFGFDSDRLTMSEIGEASSEELLIAAIDRVIAAVTYQMPKTIMVGEHTFSVASDTLFVKEVSFDDDSESSGKVVGDEDIFAGMGMGGMGTAFGFDTSVKSSEDTTSVEHSTASELHDAKLAWATNNLFEILGFLRSDRTTLLMKDIGTVDRAEVSSLYKEVTDIFSKES